MGHRNTYFVPQLSNMGSYRSWNHRLPNPRLHLENGSFVFPMENVAVGGVNTTASFNMSVRSNVLPLDNFSSEFPIYRETDTRLAHGPYLHSSSAGNHSRVDRSHYLQYGPTCYNHSASGVMSNTVSPQPDYGRVPFKRKIPIFSATLDRGSSSGYYSTGSSSSFDISSDPLQSNPGSGSRFWPRDPTSMDHEYRNNSLLITGEGSQRNVRRRHSHTVCLDRSEPYPPSNLSHRTSSANVSGTTVAGEWSHTSAALDSHRRVISSDVGSFSHETNRSLVGGNIRISGLEIDGDYHSNSVLTQDPSTSSPAFHVPSPIGTLLSRSSYHGQRTTPRRAMLRYRSMGFAAVDGRRPGVDATIPLRHSRPLSSIGRSGERIGRGRNIYDRVQAFSDEDTIHNRWVSQGVAMLDRSPLYYSGSFFDQHRDMRLDTDNMSYEELLALGERIGNVSTGLSEETILKHLTTFISDQTKDDEEESCIICLEEYRDGDGMGRLNCGHKFHFSCIKKWLLIKKACPVCKASAAED